MHVCWLRTTAVWKKRTLNKCEPQIGREENEEESFYQTALHQALFISQRPQNAIVLLAYTRGIHIFKSMSCGLEGACEASRVLIREISSTSSPIPPHARTAPHACQIALPEAPPLAADYENPSRPGWSLPIQLKSTNPALSLWQFPVLIYPNGKVFRLQDTTSLELWPLLVTTTWIMCVLRFHK